MHSGDSIEAIYSMCMCVYKIGDKSLKGGNRGGGIGL